MAIHLADCLKNFGPVQSWWAYPFERLMGSILKVVHNDHLGEMEVTCVTSSCQMENLSALLQDKTKLPQGLRPFASQLQRMFEPLDSSLKFNNIFASEAVDDESIDQLVYPLNAIHANNKDWRSSSKWWKIPTEERKKYLPVSSQAEFKNGIKTMV
ncbi:hypothetical protein DFH28DRAFT_903866 [Melampsora americana]|nr:hypothetical protein DFH28DRAFT_903866 [Melampsora americana]